MMEVKLHWGETRMKKPLKADMWDAATKLWLQLFDCRCRSLHVQQSHGHPGGRCQAILTWAAWKAADRRQPPLFHLLLTSVSAERDNSALKNSQSSPEKPTHAFHHLDSAKTSLHGALFPVSAVTIFQFVLVRNAFLEHFCQLQNTFESLKFGTFTLLIKYLQNSMFKTFWSNTPLRITLK